MDGTKVCPRCRGEVVVNVIREEKPDRTYTSYATGVCRGCGATFDEAEVLKLEGTGPVGG